MSGSSIPPNSPGRGRPVSGDGYGPAERFYNLLDQSRRQACAVQARIWRAMYIQVRVILAFVPFELHDNEFHKLYQRIALTQNISWRVAARHLNNAYLLHSEFQRVCRHLEAGDFTPQLAEVFVQESLGITEEAKRQEFTDKLLPEALKRGMTASRLRRLARRLGESLCAETIEKRHRETIAEETSRGVRVTDLGDGVVALRCVMNAADGYSVAARLTRIAVMKQKVFQELEAPVPSRGRLEHETATELLTGKLDPEYAGVQGQVRVTIPLLSLETGTSRHTLEQLKNTVSKIAGLSGNALLDGYGPIPVTHAVRLAAEQREWHRMFTDPHSGIALRTDSRKPSATLKRFLLYRDPTCRWIGCEVSADHADADHTVPWSAGGETSDLNLSHLCRRHHVLKHHGGLGLKQLGGGRLEWTLPNGERIVDEPFAALPQAPEATPVMHGGEPPPF